MTTKRIFKRLPLVIAGLAMGLGVFISVDGFRNNKQAEETTAYYTPSTHYEVSDTASELSSYYSSISSGDTGTTLLSKLQSLNSTKRKKTMGYSTMGTSISSSPYSYTDYDLNNTAVDSNGQIYGTKVASFYTKTSATDWNREHVWPNSRGGSSVEGDILHTRPTISSENSSRGNSMYVEGKNSSSAGWDPYTAGYDAACRGECARIILYSVVASTSLSLVAADNDDTSNKTMGNMNTLIKWHFDYSPSVYEINRNNGAEYLQGNRNPFVDHPEYVARIWSSFNSTISTLCNNNASMYENWVPGSASTYGTNDAVDPTGVSISKTSVSLTVDNTTTISATSSNSSTITWSTSNNSVASISSTSAASGSSITITANAAGSATITAKATISGVQYTKTCSVTVTTSGGGGDTPVGDSYTLVNTDMPSSYPSSDTQYTAASGLKFYGYQVMNQSGKIQLKNGQGYIYNSDSLNLGTLSISGLSGSITVYKGSTRHPTTTTVTGSNGSYDLSGSNYFTIKANSGSVVTCTNITVGIASSSAKTLSSISISGYNTSFVEGDTFSFGGTVTANYSDNTTENVTSQATFTGYNMTSTGNQTVTVSYGGKTATYQINVSQGTLSSISISNYTTSYPKGATFSFDGTCTAVFTNGYQKTVVPTSVTTPDMSTAGTKNITVSYTYNGKTKSASYQITVTSYRTVIEEGYGVIGTIVYTSDSEVISVNTLSTSASGGYSQIDTTYHAWRLGAGSKTGTLTVNSTTSNIRKITVNAKYYGSDSGTTFTIGGTSQTLTNSYADYTKEYNSATNSVGISSVSNGKRVLIASITVYSYSSQDIGQTEDCVGLESFINTYMHMDYTQNLGYCKDGEHHYYSTAKSAFNGLNTHQRNLFVNNSAYADELARLSAWASANGEVLNASNQLAQGSNMVALTTLSQNNNAITLVIIISMVGMSSIGICLYIRKKRFHI